MNKLGDQRIPLPISIVTIYPAFTIGNNSISKSFVMLEPLIELHLYLLMVSKYGANLSDLSDFKKVEKSKKKKFKLYKLKINLTFFI